MIWRNALYKEGYAETLIGDPRRHLEIRELETVVRYFWNLALEDPTRDKISARNATEQRLTDPRLMVEMSPKAVSFSQSGPSSSGGPHN